jgi:hypothetical protein
MMRRQIAQFTKAVKEYCSCQGVLCFTFVQTDLNSAAEFRILQPFEGKQGSLDAT